MASIILHLAAAAAFGTLQRPASRADIPCREPRDAAIHALHELSPIGTRPVRNKINGAFVQFRLHRTNEATVSIDSALSLLEVTRGRLMTSDERAGVRNAIGEMQRCIDRSTAPPLSTLTVRTYEQDDRVADGRGAPAEPGALVRVDEFPVGRTGAGGMFRGLVPSGPLRVTAEIPPSEWGEAAIDLPPRGVRAVSALLQSSKEVTEETPLIVAEARGGVLSATSPTVTLKFVEPAVAVLDIDEINLLGPSGNLEVDLKPLFTIANGVIVAVDPAKVIAMMRAHLAGPLVLMVQASGKDDVIHASRVEFRVE